ncbi:MAG: ATP-binding protein [Candidatus Limnocylindria bacterium]
MAFLRRTRRGLLPRTFQGRLTVAFVLVIVLTLALVGALVVNRLDDYFARQQEADLNVRSETVQAYVIGIANDLASPGPVVEPDLTVDPAVAAFFQRQDQARLIADRLGQADVIVRFGFTIADGDQVVFVPATDGLFQMPLQAAPEVGQTREPQSVTYRYASGSLFQRYTVEITLANPYTYRATALANLTGLLAAITLFALGLAVLVSAALARRFTTPLRQLTEASRGLAEGDLSRRVPMQRRAGSTEIIELAVQFNAMADRLEQSVEIIRRDRDRSRDFLADVSHELRTPLAALRTFNQLLMESAGDDPDARAEFLESSAGQIERLDWLAQNLLELSKLDSGLVLLDLRPDDLRAAVESAVQQLDATATRRGVALELRLPDGPVRIRHDPPRVGQVVTNLVGNALKFTPRGGRVTVEVAATEDGARIDVADTGVGIDPQELPHIFERFYRGARSSEARGSGSGLGLAIVRSIVDMHGGSVTVESGAGGSRFVVDLPRDPRLVAGTPAAARADVASAAEGSARIARKGDGPRPAEPGEPAAPAAPTPPVAPAAPTPPVAPAGSANVVETSPSEPPRMNPASAP